MGTLPEILRNGSDYGTVPELIINFCRRLSSELETVGTAARDFEERLRFQLETSLRTEEENETKVRQMTANLSALGRGKCCADL